MAKILIVEDEEDFSRALKEILTLEGFEVSTVESLAEYYDWVTSNQYDLRIIDRTLPDGDGIEIMRQPLKDDSKVSIFLTGMGKSDEKIRAHNLDADYYLVKPVDINELISIVRRSLRRVVSDSLDKNSKWYLDCKSWTINKSHQKNINLTHKEMTFMKCFVGLEGLAVRRQTIIRALGFSPDAYDIRRLEAMVSRLRKKIEDSGFESFPLTTVYGVGYAFNDVIDVVLSEIDI